MNHSPFLPHWFNAVLNQAKSRDKSVIADIERKQFDVVRERYGSNQYIGYGRAMTKAVMMKQFRKAKRDDRINGDYGNSRQLFHRVPKRTFVALTHLNLGNCYRRDRDVIKAESKKLVNYFRSVEKELNHHVGIAEHGHRHAIFRISLREIFLPFHKPASARNSFSDLKVPLGISFRNGCGFGVTGFFFFVLAAVDAFIGRKFFFKDRNFNVFKNEDL